MENEIQVVSDPICDCCSYHFVIDATCDSHAVICVGTPAFSTIYTCHFFQVSPIIVPVNTNIRLSHISLIFQLYFWGVPYDSMIHLECP